MRALVLPYRVMGYNFSSLQIRDLASLLVLYDLAIVLFSRVSISANVSNLLSCLITVLLVNFHFSIIQVCFGSIVTSLSGIWK